MKKILLILFCCFLTFHSLAQTGADSILPRQDSPTIKRPDTPNVPKPDTIRKRDTTARKISVPRDTSIRKVTTVVDTPALTHTGKVEMEPPPPPAEMKIEGDLLAGWKPDTLQYISRLRLFQAVLRDHPYYYFFGEPIAMTVQEKKTNGREAMFYFLVGLLIFYGFIRLAFGKYIDNLTTLFFRVTMRQQQIRDQLLQSPLPSLCLNLLYIVTGGFFLSFVVKYYNIVPITNQWILFAGCAALLIVIYVGKLIVLKLTGWIFNISHATDTYIFIVFLVNKMIGIFLLPVLIFMAFAGPVLFKVILTLAFLVLVIFFIYRFVISYRPIRNEIKLNRFHFFLYLCAFEIAPLLLIYKVLLIFVERSY